MSNEVWLMYKLKLVYVYCIYVYVSWGQVGRDEGADLI